MPAVQVREFPHELYRRLQNSAEQDYRSMSNQVIVLIEEALDNRMRLSSVRDDAANAGMNGSNRKALFERIRQTPLPECIDNAFPSDVDLIREDRDAR